LTRNYGFASTLNIVDVDIALISYEATALEDIGIYLLEAAE